MPSNSLHRRLYVGVLSTGLLAGVLIPLGGASAASCAAWTDAKGDATTDQSGQAVLADAQLDIVSAALGTVGKDLVGTITTDGLGSGSSDAGDEFRFRFTILEQDVLFYVDRTAPLGEELDVRAGFYNLTTDETGDATAEFDVENKTVKLIGPLEQLALAVGKPVNGQAVKDLRAETLNQVAFGALTPAQYDDAPTPLKPVVGTACTFKGAPAPAASGPASAAPSPTSASSAAPSAAASAAPSSSASAAPSAAASGSAAPSAAPSATPKPQPTVPVPATGCFGFEDAKGDAKPGGQAPNEPGLDLLSVTGRTSDAMLLGHLQVDRLAARPSFPAFTGQRFEYQFTIGGKVVLLRATAEGPAEALVDGVVVPDLKATAVFDVVSSQVVLGVDRRGLAKALTRELPEGTFLEAQTGRSIARSPAPVAFTADTATSEDPARARYTVGDNTCFAPKISASLPGRVQTSDGALISISMTTSDGRVAAGQLVTARVGTGRAVSARTDKQGHASLTAPVSDAAGSRLLVVRSKGSAGEGELQSEMRVVTERALLSLRTTGTGASRTVTAALTDDDRVRRLLAGQRIVFTFGGRSVAVTTNSKGRAVTTVPAGSVVDAAFAGRTGFLTAAKARTRA